MKPKIVRTVEAMRREVAKWREDGLSVAIVPTMGALHEGHLTLIREGLDRAARVIVSIFVNPKQFAATEDLSRYPRDEEADVAAISAAGAHLVFAPPPEVMYGENFVTSVVLKGPARAGLEDRFRPGHFDGVATVVAKLFIQSGADFAIFGEKDYQQLMVVTAMARDLDIPTAVIGIPTVRNDEGLALSSRNRYLNRHESHQAAAIHKNLEQAAEKIRRGVNPQTATRAAARSLTTLGFQVDYVTARNAETLAVPVEKDEPLRLLAAARLGATRLIDNIAV